VLVIAGDVTPETALEKVKRYFGDIPAGPPWPRIPHGRPSARAATGRRPRTGSPRRAVKVWNIPEWGSIDEIHLDLLSDVMASGKTSRLFKRLVYDDQIATSVTAYVDPVK